VRQGDRLGYFGFPRSVLLERGVFADGGRGGKRGFRIYPAWVLAPSDQAARTRSWQIRHFAEAPITPDQAAALFGGSAHG
jgi:hypothetical protein